MLRLRLTLALKAEKMVCASPQACLSGILPVFLKFYIDVTAAFRRFDKSKIDPFPLENLPVDLSLIVRNIHTTDRIVCL